MPTNKEALWISLEQARRKCIVPTVRVCFTFELNINEFTFIKESTHDYIQSLLDDKYILVQCELVGTLCTCLIILIVDNLSAPLALSAYKKEKEEGKFHRVGYVVNYFQSIRNVIYQFVENPYLGKTHKLDIKDSDITWGMILCMVNDVNRNIKHKGMKIFCAPLFRSIEEQLFIYGYNNRYSITRQFELKITKNEMHS